MAAASRQSQESPLGAHYTDNSCNFKLWAPLKQSVTLHLLDPDEKISMQKDSDGYFTATVTPFKPGRKYCFNVDDLKKLPDPASHYQPYSVHGPSQVVDHHAFEWHDQTWRGIPFRDLILYELHVGTFTEKGTFEAIIPRLDDLRDSGINAIEIMPVAQFPGNRNWGYDGVFPYAVQNSYGGPDGFKKLVDACHQRGMAVILDVVYNHLGPEGNYLSQFAPYFTNKYCTPWGDAINFDGEWSDGVREYFADNVAYWIDQYHLDGLRLDAVHMIFDNGARPFWHFLHDRVKVLQEIVGRPLHMIAESDLNSPRTVQPPIVGGHGFSAQWLDDFHHALYVMIDSEGRDRYVDFGTMEQLAKAYTDGFVHSGEYVKFRKRKHGVSSAGIPGDRFVIFSHNHDQIGNRPLGERLCSLVDFRRLQLAAAAVLLAPYVPMLFMGEEYGDPSPFYYFVSHSDEQLIEAVRKGRKEEFKDFNTKGESPDAQDEKTFKDSKLKWSLRNEGAHADLLAWYEALIRLRKESPALKTFDKNCVRAHVINQSALAVYRQDDHQKETVLCLFNFGEEPVAFAIPFTSHPWKLYLDSNAFFPMEQDTPTMPAQISNQAHITLSPLTAAIYGSGR